MSLFESTNQVIDQHFYVNQDHSTQFYAVGEKKEPVWSSDRTCDVCHELTITCTCVFSLFKMMEDADEVPVWFLSMADFFSLRSMCFFPFLLLLPLTDTRHVNDTQWLDFNGGSSLNSKEKQKVSSSDMKSVPKHIMVDVLFRSVVKVYFFPCCESGLLESWRRNSLTNVELHLWSQR